jgi:hypothetical protein
MAGVRPRQERAVERMPWGSMPGGDLLPHLSAGFNPANFFISTDYERLSRYLHWYLCKTELTGIDEKRRK